MTKDLDLKVFGSGGAGVDGGPAFASAPALRELDGIAKSLAILGPCHRIEEALRDLVPGTPSVEAYVDVGPDVEHLTEICPSAPQNARVSRSRCTAVGAMFGRCERGYYEAETSIGSISSTYCPTLVQRQSPWASISIYVPTATPPPGKEVLSYEHFGEACIHAIYATQLRTCFWARDLNWRRLSHALVGSDAWHEFRLMPHLYTLPPSSMFRSKFKFDRSEKAIRVSGLPAAVAKGVDHIRTRRAGKFPDKNQLVSFIECSAAGNMTVCSTLPPSAPFLR